MNKPSPEGMKAALAWDKTRDKDINSFPSIIEAFAYGHDISREELDFIKTEHAILNARLHGEVHPKDNGDWHGMINIPELLKNMSGMIRIIAADTELIQQDTDLIQKLAHALKDIGEVVPRFEYVLKDSDGRDIWLHDLIASTLGAMIERKRKEGDESCQADSTSTALSSVAPKGSTPAAATTTEEEFSGFRDCKHEGDIEL